MSLQIGKIIYGYQYDELSIEDYAIRRVEGLEEKRDPPIINRGIPFLNGHQEN